MSINQCPISISDIEILLPIIQHRAEQLGISLSFFECTTLLAFEYFEQKHVDVAVLETGLGGRYDATNVIQHPSLSIITSIGEDHMHILGSSLEEIAREKAGIMKKGVPALIGPQAPHSVFQQVKIKSSHCINRGAMRTNRDSDFVLEGQRSWVPITCHGSDSE